MAVSLQVIEIRIETQADVGRDMEIGPKDGARSQQEILPCYGKRYKVFHVVMFQLFSFT